MTDWKLAAVIVAFIGLAVAAAVVGHARQEVVEQTMAATAPISAAPTRYVEAATGVTWAIRGATGYGYYGGATATCPAGTTIQAQFKRSWCCYETSFEPTYQHLAPGDCTGQTSCSISAGSCGYDCGATEKVLILCTK